MCCQESLQRKIYAYADPQLSVCSESALVICTCLTPLLKSSKQQYNILNKINFSKTFKKICQIKTFFVSLPCKFSNWKNGNRYRGNDKWFTIWKYRIEKSACLTFSSFVGLLLASICLQLFL